MERIVIAAYRPKTGKELELKALMATHLSTLRSQDLVTERESIMMEAADGTILEVFEWRSREAITAAHENSVVLEMWEKCAAACDFIPAGEVAEIGQMFSEFTPLD